MPDRCLLHFPGLGTRQLNLEKQSGADGLTGMYTHDGCPSVFMTQKVMAPLCSQDGKPDLAQRRHKISAGDPRPPAHAATVMR